MELYRQRTMPCRRENGFFQMAYTEWGEETAERTVICVHGLTRNGRDFDALAQRLAQAGYRVLCPDVLGRGASDWLPSPLDYGYPQYLSDMAQLMARSCAQSVDWIGTSMGGLLGMMLAAQPQSPIRRLVINDIGPFIPAAALQRIVDYVGTAPLFPSVTEGELYLRQVLAPFGHLSDSQWSHLASHSLRPVKDQPLWQLAYDPAIGEALRVTPIHDVDLWPLWSMVHCPVHVLRGTDSDLLLPETFARLLTSPLCSGTEVPGCGHAPYLDGHDDQQAILNFLQQT